MSLLFNSQGYFCAKNIKKNWQFEMELGRIILKEDMISLIGRSNKDLTEITSSIDNYDERYKIPLVNINNVYIMQKLKNFIIKVETKDDFIFSIIISDDKSPVKEKSLELVDLINTSILSLINFDDESICQLCGKKMKPESIYCSNCGVKKESNYMICKYCGVKNKAHVKFCEKCVTKLY